MASQPPTVERWNDCGKKRRVSPWGRSPSSSAGPWVPARTLAARASGSTSTTPASRPRSSETAPAQASPTSGSTPPTTLVPPPNGTTATPAPDHVAVGTPEPVAGAVVRRAGGDRRQRGRWPQPRRRRLGQRRGPLRGLRLEAEHGLHRRPERLQRRRVGLLPRQPPTPDGIGRLLPHAGSLPSAAPPVRA